MDYTLEAARRLAEDLRAIPAKDPSARRLDKQGMVRELAQDLVLAIRSPFRVGVNGLDGPGEGVGDEGDQLLQGAPEGCWFPATIAVGEVEDPDVDAVPGETHVLVHVVVGSRLDDDSGSVPARAKVREVAGVKQALYGFGVGVLSLLLGHRWLPRARLAADS